MYVDNWIKFDTILDIKIVQLQQHSCSVTIIKRHSTIILVDKNKKCGSGCWKKCNPSDTSIVMATAIVTANVTMTMAVVVTGILILDNSELLKPFMRLDP